MQSYIPPRFTDNERIAKIQKTFPEIDAIYREFAETNHCPGYAYGIIVDGKLAHSGSGGFIDIDKKIPTTTKSMFRIASMTKSFTAMAILMLRDEGKLRLDDPVYLYIPEIKNQQLTADAPVITVRDLLTHSEGFPTDDPWGDRQLDATDEELIALLKNGVFFSNVTGITYEYSNLGYALLGYIIKKVSAISYEEFIEKKICHPIGMKDVAMDFRKVTPSQLSHGYRWINEQWSEEALLPDGVFGAMGGMIASIESFSHYVALHQSAWPPRDDKETAPLKRSTLREMHQPWRFSELVTGSDSSEGDDPIRTIAYGYGLRWTRDSKGRVFVGHSGGLPGFGSNWSFMPDHGVGVIFFANVTYVGAHKINQKTLYRLSDAAELKPRQLPASKVLKDRQSALTKLLPDWKNGETSGIFAENFFLDYPIDVLIKEGNKLYENAGKILSVSDLVAENQLRGSFTLVGEKADLQISFSLSPENPPLIQEYRIKELTRNDSQMEGVLVNAYHP